MSSKQTDNLGLHSWERTDAFLMDEFNDNFSKLDQAVGEKADQTALDALAGQVAEKAEKSALESLAGQVDKKAESTALAALAGRVGALETGRLVWTLDSYTGNATHGLDNPRRLEFDFKPLVVIVADSINWPYGGFPWINGMRSAHQYLSYNSSAFVYLQWESRALQFYCNETNTTNAAERNLDLAGRVYKYFALGVAE